MRYGAGFWFQVYEVSGFKHLDMSEHEALIGRGYTQE